MIITIICITILAHLITGKDVKPLVEKLKTATFGSIPKIFAVSAVATTTSASF